MFEIIAIRKHAMVRYKYLFVRVLRNLKIKKLGTIINLEKDLIFTSSPNKILLVKSKVKITNKKVINFSKLSSLKIEGYTKCPKNIENIIA
tara:strand:+ start:16702 stop:16974 length:273 start_codon:yes stop_codon:yes gene_type:complete